MIEWWKRRQERKAEVAAREKRMRLALKRLDEDHAKTKHVTEDDVERIGKEVADASAEAISILEAAEGTHGTG